MQTVKIGTRASRLALTQSQQTADKLAAIGGFTAELVHVKTDGDVLTGPLSQMGGTGVFVTALRDALLTGRCDIAVHSLKDLPTGPADGLRLAALPAREDVRDVLCARDGLTFAELPVGAKVGTGSPRRAAQLRAARSDLEVVDIRGNVDTRLGRVAGLPGNQESPDGAQRVDGKSGDLDAVVLAAAGLARIGRLDTVSEFFAASIMLPAPGQGALAVECRAGDAPGSFGAVTGTATGAPGVLAQALAALDDADTRLSVTAERALLARLEAGCSAPVGALAHRKGSLLYLEAVVCAVDGSAAVRLRKATDSLTEVGATLLGIDLAEELLLQGAGELADLAGTGR
ncbi:hydroxymethylbilane synthase [Paenarthrobacter sp. PH39-S1]|uniref:hydroxymethylbilane synthase n=1 Tax=Paenarthrobacter sp. PH39-S1 TaxID=3046204 RepID=UPI0024BA13C6|nr:hydroxymethylbilane synthase [Paenarthrobacter sp. PH39-S1]MDJ0355569.1 hydroxymethylbilane synthase [Paenarthrobacter sp. PH39-S1]